MDTEEITKACEAAEEEFKRRGENKAILPLTIFPDIQYLQYANHGFELGSVKRVILQLNKVFPSEHPSYFTCRRDRVTLLYDREEFSDRRNSLNVHIMLLTALSQEGIDVHYINPAEGDRKIVLTLPPNSTLQDIVGHGPSRDRTNGHPTWTNIKNKVHYIVL
jgi:hypothetical protein